MGMINSAIIARSHCTGGKELDGFHQRISELEGRHPLKSPMMESDSAFQTGHNDERHYWIPVLLRSFGLVEICR
ncbi:hypothetical protein BH23CHL2_BH23CHL2_24170 [soil metagenome]